MCPLMNMNQKNSSWVEVYAEKIKLDGSLKYVDRKAKEKSALIENIINNTPKEGRILEAGCGTAAISIYLGNLGYNVTALDVEPDMLELARDISKNFERKPNFVVGDIRYLKFARNSFDTSFSNGVLEHFSDEEIRRSIEAQTVCCRRVIFSVPSKFFRENEKIYGDERFLTKEKWRELIEESNARVISEFEFSYKETNHFKNLYLFSRSILGCIKPYIGFVVKNKRISL